MGPVVAGVNTWFGPGQFGRSGSRRGGFGAKLTAMARARRDGYRIPRRRRCSPRPQKVDRRDHGSFERGRRRQCPAVPSPIRPGNDAAIDAGGDTATCGAGELADGRQPDAMRLGDHDGRTQWCSLIPAAAAKPQFIIGESSFAPESASSGVPRRQAGLVERDPCGGSKLFHHRGLGDTPVAAGARLQANSGGMVASTTAHEATRRS